MAECEGLAFVSLARMKMVKIVKRANNGCDKYAFCLIQKEHDFFH
jgi:hypothetical protein